MFGKKPGGAALAPQTEPGLTRWSPWDEMADIRRQMDDLFGRPFGYTPLTQLIPGSGFNFEPPLDIYTTDDKLVVYTALPGFTPEAIHVEAQPETLTIYGERKALYDQDKDIPEKQSGVMGESRFRIQCTLPAEIDPNKVTATFRDGILKLEMTRPEQARTRSVKVAVNPT